MAIALSACNRTPQPSPEAGAKQYELSGIVKKLDPELPVATVEAEEIPGWMAAMAMEYPVRNKKEFAALRVGEKIRAKVYVTSDFYWIAQIHEELAAAEK